MGKKNHIDFISCNQEKNRLENYWAQNEPVILVGPTGCGKTTLVHEAALKKGQEIETVVCSDNMTRRHLLGGFIITPEGSVWKDGPLTVAVKKGSIFYLDEVDYAVGEWLTILFPLIDHRRRLYIPEIGTTLDAADNFRFVGSYNPKPGQTLPSAFRQRCCFIRFDYLPPEKEMELICRQTPICQKDAKFLVQVGQITRKSKTIEAVGTRLLLRAAANLTAGMSREMILTDFFIEPIGVNSDVKKTFIRLLEMENLIGSGELEELKTQHKIDGDDIFTDDNFFETSEKSLAE